MSKSVMKVMKARIEKLNADIKRSLANAKRTRHAKFKSESIARVKRLQARVQSIKSAVKAAA